MPGFVLLCNPAGCVSRVHCSVFVVENCSDTSCSNSIVRGELSSSESSVPMICVFDCSLILPSCTEYSRKDSRYIKNRGLFCHKERDVKPRFC